MAHVLLIEPDALLVRTYRAALEREGHTVQVCSSAQGAIAAADERRPDVVVLELQLVGHSGVEFLYEFRSYADWQGVPIILHTQVPAGEFAASRELLYGDLGVAAYLYKPQTSLGKLVRIVRQLAPTG